MEASLWRRLRFEHERRCRESLFNRYLALARAIAHGERRKRPAYGLDPADFEQFAYGGLLEAIDRYDPLRGIPFDAYARRRIRGAIADGANRSSESGAQYSCRRRMQTDRLHSLRNGADIGADPIGELADLAAALAIGLIAEKANLEGGPQRDPINGYDTLPWLAFQRDIFRCVDDLPEAEKTVLEHHYRNGISFSQIAQLMHLSASRISQLHHSGLKRLRARLTDEDRR